MNDDNIIQTYGFTYMDCDGKTYKKEISTEGATWSEALNDYVRFLESVFQYDIRSQVRIKEPKYQHLVEDEWGYIDPWTGQYFNDDDDNEPVEAW